MNMKISEYLNKLATKLKQGNATEHTYRGDLQLLIESMFPRISATNEPKRIACGAPDYILLREDIPVGYIEAKDIDAALRDKKHQEQFNRYKNSLDNLIITNYIDFELFINGEFIDNISIARVDGNKLTPLNDNFAKFSELLKTFTGYNGQTIKSTVALSKMMAQKAKLLAQVIEQSLHADELNKSNSSIFDQYQGFKQILIHDIAIKEFADVYAQTITYGMFAARLHDSNLDTFSRQEAATLIPKSNPFLRNLFQYIAGFDLDSRIVWIVDAIAEMFRAVDLASLLKNFVQKSQQQDPIIHFYENFLAEYDPKLRKARGVWYTPEAVVNFIVRAVDDVLKTEFAIKDGLASSEKTTIEVDAGIDKKGKTQKQKHEVHKIQILDPATGTGTFLAEIVKFIYQSKFRNMQGLWNSYVSNHLIPRLNGFEILMASYAMAHLKLDLLLHEYGYMSENDQRFRIFLTNSLEEYHPDTGTLFTSWLSNEANEANYIKRDTPVMVVLGNPPYNGHSANKGEWIEKILNDYKQEPSGGKLQEKNPKWLNDDYVKFIRYGEYFVEKNGEGVLAYINNHSFLDNPTFRGMRYKLLQTFDKIYIIDLHGNSKKKEQTPDGNQDENVFDIQQGVSINIFIKTGNKKKNQLAEVYHHDMYGLRDAKYTALWDNDLSSVKWQKLNLVAPQYYLVPKNFDLMSEYKQGFAVNELFTVNSVGIVTSRDSLVIDEDKECLSSRIKEIFTTDKKELVTKYNIKENKTWTIDNVKQQAKEFNAEFIQLIAYRPFDNRYIYFESNFIERMRGEVMQHFIKLNNVGLTLNKQYKAGDNYQHILVTDKIIESSLVSNKTSEICSSLPLYLYNDNLISEPQPNLDNQIVTKFCNKLGLPLVVDGRVRSDGKYPEYQDQITPLNILDYIYAVLHNTSYRAKYAEFLKIDFPRVPYPTDKTIFWQLVKLGSQLRQVHLLQSSLLDEHNINYPIDGNNVVEKPEYKNNQIWINQTQYFDNIPETAWSFYIGGYQPAQKWLKDRKDKQLSYDDIVHYMKIITALSLTATIMAQINTVEKYDVN
jgi:predicted helicase